MKKINVCIFALALTLFMKPAFSQNVAINADGSLPDNNAILDIKSFNKGILIPRVSTSARVSIAATKGLLVYDTTTNSFWYHTGSAWQNLASSSNAWSLNGNSGTDSTNYIGVIENKPLIFKVGGTQAGRIDIPGKFNTTWGYDAVTSNTTGILLTAIGFSSLHNNTTGTLNVAVGSDAMYSNTTGGGNTATGHLALSDNTTGSNNTATGFGALYHSGTGSNNVANGDAALNNNRSGGSNTACGSGSLGNDTASYNTAVGALSLNRNMAGTMNTGLGFQTLWGNISGSNNTAVGSLANVSADGLTNATAIGYATFVNASNKVRIGNSAVTVIEGQVPFTTPSDGRFKFNVQEDVKGLSFINQLRPVTYQFDVKRFDAQHAGVSTNSDVQWASYNEATQMRRSGFIAQEVEKAAVATGYDFSGIIKPKTEQDHYGLSYESFVVPLVKAVQELSKQVIDLQNQVNQLKQSQATPKQ